MEESTLPKLSNHLLKQTKRLNIHLQNIWQKCELAKCSQNSLRYAGTCEAETKVGSGAWVLINSLKRKHCHLPKWDRSSATVNIYHSQDSGESHLDTSNTL